MNNSPTMTNIARFPQVRISLHESLVIENEQAARCVNTDTALTATAYSGGRYMAHKANNAPSADAQRFIDPTISHARVVNDVAMFERNLAARKALRPIRSQAAAKGWDTRRG
jgi:hypothetical protein